MTVGTIFENSKISLRTWFATIYLGISAGARSLLWPGSFFTVKLRRQRRVYQKALGYTNIKTAENDLDGLEKEVKKS